MRFKLAESELAVMQLLWEHKKLTSRQIMETLYNDRGKSQHGTVQKLLQRLEKKGFILRERETKIQQFSAKVSQEEYAGNQFEHIVSRLTSGSITPLITYLLESRKLNKADLKEIEDLISKYKEEGNDDN